MIINPLKKYLDDRGLSGLEFSAKCGVSFPTIYRIMKGEHKPYRRTVMKICRHCKGELTSKDFGYE